MTDARTVPQSLPDVPASGIGSGVLLGLLHVVMYSGGICSWATAKRVVERHGKENVALLFADTLEEAKGVAETFFGIAGSGEFAEVVEY